MNSLQRIVLVLGCAGLVHTALVPPVLQPEGDRRLELLAAEEGDLDATRPPAQEECRYARFLDTRWPFTRGYDVPRASFAAMASEGMLVVGATGFLYLLLGLARRGGGRPGA